MVQRWGNCIEENCSTTSAGTGPYTTTGATSNIPGTRPLSAICSIGDTFRGRMSDLVTGAFVDGLWTYSAANQVTITTIEDSSNGGAAVSFAVGNARKITHTATAASFIELDALAVAAGVVAPTTVTTMAGTDLVVLNSGTQQITANNLQQSLGQTMSQGAVANAVSDPDMVWTNQSNSGGSSSDVVTTANAIWTYISGKLTSTFQPATIRIATQTTILDATSHNRRTLVFPPSLAAGAQVNPASSFASILDGFECVLWNRMTTPLALGTAVGIGFIIYPAGLTQLAPNQMAMVRATSQDGTTGTLEAVLLGSGSASASLSMSLTQVGASAGVIADQATSVAFTVAGSLSGYSSPPSLYYSDDTTTWSPVPTAALLSNTNYSFVHPGLTNGAKTIRVKDSTGTTPIATASFIVATPGVPLLTITSIPAQTIPYGSTTVSVPVTVSLSAYPTSPAPVASNFQYSLDGGGSWTLTGGSVTGSSAPYQLAFTLAAVTAGAKNLTVRDYVTAGVAVSAAVTFTATVASAPASMTISSIPGTGSTGGNITVVVAPVGFVPTSFSYSWSGSGGSGTVSSFVGNTLTVPSSTVVGSGTVTITGTDGTASASITSSAVVFSAPAAMSIVWIEPQALGIVGQPLTFDVTYTGGWSTPTIKVDDVLVTPTASNAGTGGVGTITITAPALGSSSGTQTGTSMGIHELKAIGTAGSCQLTNFMSQPAATEPGNLFLLTATGGAQITTIAKPSGAAVVSYLAYGTDAAHPTGGSTLPGGGTNITTAGFAEHVLTAAAQGMSRSKFAPPSNLFPTNYTTAPAMGTASHATEWAAGQTGYKYLQVCTYNSSTHRWYGYVSIYNNMNWDTGTAAAKPLNSGDPLYYWFITSDGYAHVIQTAIPVT